MTSGRNGREPARVDLEELKGVNERLRGVIAALKSNRERLQADPEPAAPPPPAAEAPETASRRLEAELAAARAALEARSAEEEQLRARLVEIEREHRRICDEYAAVQDQSSALTALFVALARLHGSLERREVLAALQEVVVNVLGSEQLAVFEPGPAERLRAVHAFGVDGSRLADVRPGEGAIGRAALGQRFVATAGIGADDPDLTACVPLRVGDRVTGVLAVWRLLDHKRSLHAADLELIELLSTHAGTALHAARLDELYGSRPG